MQVADLNIIPSRPSMFDLWASARTRAALKEIGGDFVFLLNQCPPAQQTARVQDGVETLEEMGGLISPSDPDAGRLPGIRASWLGRDRTQPLRRGGRGNARPLAVHQAPSGARQGPAARPQGGMRFEASPIGSLYAKARAAILPPLAQIGRTLPGALPFFHRPHQPPSRVRIVSRAALDGQVPQPRAFGAGLLQIARRRRSSGR